VQPPNYVRIWKNIFQVLADRPEGRGFRSTLISLRDGLNDLTQIAFDEDAFALLSVDSDSLQAAADDLERLVGMLEDKVSDIGMWIARDLKPKVNTLNPTDPIPPAKEWQARDVMSWKRTGTFVRKQMTLDDFAADARAAAQSLAHDSRFSQVVLLGHSEGSALALLAARQGAPVAGVISVSGLGRPLGVVMREQLARQFDSATLVRYDTAMAQYLRGEQPKDVPPQLSPLFVPINLSFMKSLTAFDPPAAIRVVRQPVLIVQGGRDLQVTVADAERLHTANPDAQLVVVPLANHVLKQTTDTTLMGQMPTYQNPRYRSCLTWQTAIADWILRLRS